MSSCHRAQAEESESRVRLTSASLTQISRGFSFQTWTLGRRLWTTNICDTFEGLEPHACCVIVSHPPVRWVQTSDLRVFPWESSQVLSVAFMCSPPPDTPKVQGGVTEVTATIRNLPSRWMWVLLWLGNVTNPTLQPPIGERIGLRSESA